MDSTRGTPTEGVIQTTHGLAGGGMVVFVAFALVSTVAAFALGGGYGVAWMAIGLPLTYAAGRFVLAGFRDLADPGGREFRAAAARWELGPELNAPKGEGTVFACGHGIRLNARGSETSFEFRWNELSYRSDSNTPVLILSIQAPVFAFIRLEPTNMSEKNAWLSLLKAKGVPKDQRVGA